MADDDTLAYMPMAEPEPEQDEEGDAMWPLKREERVVELYTTELYDLTAEGYHMPSCLQRSLFGGSAKKCCSCICGRAAAPARFYLGGACGPLP